MIKLFPELRFYKITASLITSFTAMLLSHISRISNIHVITEVLLVSTVSMGAFFMIFTSISFVESVFTKLQYKYSNVFQAIFKLVLVCLCLLLPVVLMNSLKA